LHNSVSGFGKGINVLVTDEPVDMETERTHHDCADSSVELDEESRSQEGTTNFEEYFSKKKRMKTHFLMKHSLSWKKQVVPLHPNKRKCVAVFWANTLRLHSDP
jgi:hypothetical protein